MNDNRIMFGMKEQFGEQTKKFKFYNTLYYTYGEYPYGVYNLTENIKDEELNYGVKDCYIITGTKKNGKLYKLRKAILYWWDKEDTEGLICDIDHDEYWPVECMRHLEPIDEVDPR